MYDLLVKNGKVVLAEQVAEMDVAVSGGKIAAIGHGLSGAKEEIDAGGMYVLPGAIDTHIHFCDPGRTEWEGFETGSKALAAGGTTCYMDMPLNNLPATTDGETLQLKKDTAKDKNYVDYALYGGVAPYNLDKGQLRELHEGGVVGYKAFLSACGFDVPGDFKNVNDYELYEGMTQLSALNQIILVHCENLSICDNLEAKAVAAGKTDMYSYFDTRPVFNEVEAVRRAAFFAKETGCKIHFVHLSSAEAVREALRARSEGVDVSIETCPHFLALNRDECHRLGTVAKCSPAIRSKEESDLLWKEFLAGNIDTVGSDHSPCPPHMKDTGGDIFKAWGGISGCQNVLDIMFDEAVQKRGMCPAHFSKILSTNPAERFGLPGKGKIAPGFDADLVLIKPNAPYILKTEDLQYKNKHSPYVGREIGCQIIKTLVRGHTVYERGVGIAGPPTGRLHQGLRI